MKRNLLGWRPISLALAVGAGACDTTTTPPPPPPTPVTGSPCAPADTVTLAPLQGITLDCSAGTVVTLRGNGASYLVVPQFATGGDSIPYVTQPFVLGRHGDHPPISAAARAPGPVRVRHDGAQLAFDRKLRRADRRLVAMAHDASRRSRVSAAAKAPPVIGSTRTFRVVGDTGGTTVKTVSAALKYAGANLYVYVDVASPANGFTDAQLAGFGQVSDQVLYPLVLNTFGPPSDLDQDGHVTMLLTPEVNSITPAADCSTQGFVAGFFDGIDLTDDPSGNGGEIFYALVPDPTGTASCTHTVADVLNAIPSTMLHEIQHMVNFGQHVLVHGGDAEDGWLDEGLSRIAEELGSRYYEAKFPGTSGRTNPSQLFPDSAQAFIVDKLLDSYDYLTAPDTVSLTLHSDADDGLDWRAGVWLLMRYLGDLKGEGIFRTLVETGLTGLGNIAAASGQSFQTVFGNFSIALFTDSIPGVARTSIPAQYRFQTRNLRQLYQVVYNNTGAAAGPFPITVFTLPDGGGLDGTMVPGTVVYTGITTPSTSAAVSFQFSTATGTPFAANMHPQVNVFRLQ
ncbi:MAG: hypothetical protein ABI647_04850 [Gemmatimonadota bacterium]